MDNRPSFVAPRGKLQEKPKHGQPCNHCGLCCMAVLCDLGKRVFGASTNGPCPALQTEAGKSRCGLVAEPERFVPGRTLAHGKTPISDAARLLVGAQTGCDARFNGEPPDHAFYRQLQRWDQKYRTRTREAKKLWGIFS